MTSKTRLLIETLERTRTLSLSEYEKLLEGRTAESADFLRQKATEAREKTYGKRVFVRGLIEITNVCKNDCFYCGVRASNPALCRYRLSPEEILHACRRGYALGFRTFVLQGGENDWYSDERLVDLIRTVKRDCPGVAVTLSLGERSRESFAALKAAGADRYLLRHESADPVHYASLHPEGMSHRRRIECLYTLKELGYQVGAGFMVGTPHQTLSHLAQDLKFIEEFRPAMCGIGPFLPQKDTPFGKEKAGDSDLCLYLISILRLMDPALLLPATTALASASEDGCERGVLAGANVIMPNLSPAVARENYTLYDRKKITGGQSAEQLNELEARLDAIGHFIDYGRGDYQG